MLLRRVSGDSMLPSLHHGQVILVRKKISSVKLGDIVIFKHQGIEKIKRVSKIDKQLIQVIGDNQESSTDSRHFGPIERHDLIGKVIFYI